MDAKVRASIVGVTGYTGLELLRLLLAHPRVEIARLTSRQHEDAALGEIAPHLSHLPYRVTSAAPEQAAEESDVVFLCLPHGTTQDAVAACMDRARIVDLSADFRLKDPEAYKRYYGAAHARPDLLERFVYGLPEIVGRDRIKGAQNVANPGCFALLSQILLYPFRERMERADIFAVTGSSGLGKTPVEGGHHPVRSHNVRSYNVNAHRHIPEITATAGIRESALNFVPTSGPFVRGIHATAFVTTSAPADTANTYADCPFVRVTKEVALANVVGSNFADLCFREGNGGAIIAQGAIDNLVKGAAGSAVQNMNLMFGFEETEGLNQLGPVYP